MAIKMFRIAYILPNGQKAFGSYCLRKTHAELWVSILNEEHPDIQHWVEEDSLN